MLSPFSNIVEKSWMADAGLRAGVAGASPLRPGKSRDRRSLHSPRRQRQALAYVYCGAAAKLLTREEARRKPPTSPSTHERGEIPMRLIIGTVLALVLTVASSLADPVGTYRVSGINPGNGSTYSGTVTVKRNGDTFLLAWTIAGSRQIGVGIGKDDFLAVSYRSGDSIGIAFFRADENSGWEGIWAPLGSQTLGTEKWTRGP
jgi:hypothetical protein